MIRPSNFFIFISVISAAFARVVPSTHSVHEKRDFLHPRWLQGTRLHSRAILPIRIGLTQQNLDNAEEQLLDISDPDSPNFGKHWTQEQVVDHFKPTDETVDVVRDWLISSGIALNRITHSDNKAWLAFDATAEEAERLLHTEYHEFEDSVSGAVVPSCDQYHVPHKIKQHIDYITPGIKLIAPASAKGGESWKLKRSTAARKRSAAYQSVKLEVSVSPEEIPQRDNLTTCDQTITPACVAALYNIPPVDPYKKPNPNNVLGIYESELQFYYQPDLDLFFTNFTPQIPNGTHPHVYSIDGAPGPTTNASLAGEEAELDIQLAYPIVYPQKIAIWQEDDIVYETWANQTYTFGFNDFLDAIDGSYCTYEAYGEKGNSDIDPVYPDPDPEGYKGKLQCGIYRPTNVVSLSYGGQEFNVPWAYMRRQCNEYLKLGLQGISFIFASGDAGVGDYPEPYGFSGKTGCIGPNGNIFNPTWPVNCPWVTAVGATKVYPGKTVFEPESAVYDPAGHPYHVNYSSGGGFSNVYAVPSYQKEAHDSYFRDHAPSYPYYEILEKNTSQIALYGAPNGGNGIYNRIGRGIPDVAANGDNTAIYSGGVFRRAGGTSASCPIFASIINRMNEDRLDAGKKPLGFLNAILYKHPEVFNDITNGSNPNCGTNGFSAVEG
jgi:tripeptidyl-peptidase I